MCSKTDRFEHGICVRRSRRRPRRETATSAESPEAGHGPVAGPNALFDQITDRSSHFNSAIRAPEGTGDAGEDATGATKPEGHARSGASGPGTPATTAEAPRRRGTETSQTE